MIASEEVTSTEVTDGAISPSIAMTTPIAFPRSIVDFSRTWPTSLRATTARCRGKQAKYLANLFTQYLGGRI